MSHDRVVDLITGFGFAGALLLVAWVIAIGPEDRNPSSNRLYARMRSRNGRRVVAAIIAALALAILALHIIQFSTET